MSARNRAGPEVRLGLRENATQFALLVLANAFVGTIVGVERSALPLLAEAEFGIASSSAVLSFLVAFGLTKAGANFLAGELSERVGRRRVLLLGWIFGLPVPALIMVAPSWTWVVAANLLLGVNQGLAWSATVIMKIDLVGPRGRGLAMGLNEFAGYLAVALSALGAGYLAAAHGPAIAPFWIAIVAAALGLAITLVFVRDTGAHVALEHALADRGTKAGPPELPKRAMARLWHASWTRRPLLATNQAGLVNNLNDGLAWGLFPLYFTAEGLSVRQIGWLAALYPAVWGIGQLGTGMLSDRWGRRPLIVGGMLIQAVALWAFALGDSFATWLVAAIGLGVGTAAVYPTLIAQASDLVGARDRASAVGIYRLWRDLGYVVGALVAGVLADLAGFRAAIGVVALVTALSGWASRRYLPGASSQRAMPPIMNEASSAGR